MTHFLFSTSGPPSTAARSYELQHLRAIPAAIVAFCLGSSTSASSDIPAPAKWSSPCDTSTWSRAPGEPGFQPVVPAQQFQYHFHRSQLCFPAGVCNAPHPSCATPTAWYLIHGPSLPEGPLFGIPGPLEATEKCSDNCAPGLYHLLLPFVSVALGVVASFRCQCLS